MSTNAVELLMKADQLTALPFPIEDICGTMLAKTLRHPSDIYARYMFHGVLIDSWQQIEPLEFSESFDSELESFNIHSILQGNVAQLTYSAPSRAERADYQVFHSRLNPNLLHSILPGELHRKYDDWYMFGWDCYWIPPLNFKTDLDKSGEFEPYWKFEVIMTIDEAQFIHEFQLGKGIRIQYRCLKNGHELISEEFDGVDYLSPVGISASMFLYGDDVINAARVFPILTNLTLDPDQWDQYEDFLSPTWVQYFSWMDIDIRLSQVGGGDLVNFTEMGEIVSCLYTNPGV